MGADPGLPRGSHRWSHRPAGGAFAGNWLISTAAVVLHLVERGRVFRGVQGRRRRNRELIGRHKDKRRNQLAPARTQSDRNLADRVLAPLAQPGSGHVLVAIEFLVMLRAIVGPERKDRGGHLSPKTNAVRLGPSVMNLVQIFGY